VMAIADCLRIVEAGRPLSRVRQWKDAACDRFYRKRDVTEATVIEYQRNIDAGVVKDYLEAENPPIRLVALA
jgi:hypothetical protein